MIVSSLKSYGVRHKVFISYHHADQTEVNEFIEKYDHAHDIFIFRALGLSDDLINSNDTDYIMGRIRKDYLKDSTVTIVLIGKCTWARRYVDWEIQSSLRQGDVYIPNGLLGIVLPSAGSNPKAPDRLSKNLLGEKADEGYARWYWYPNNTKDLANWIEDAFQARTSRRKLIVNPRQKFTDNLWCY